MHHVLMSPTAQVNSGTQTQIQYWQQTYSHCTGSAEADKDAARALIRGLIRCGGPDADRGETQR